MSMRWRLAVSLEGLELLGDELVLRVLRHELLPRADLFADLRSPPCRPAIPLLFFSFLLDLADWDLKSRAEVCRSVVFFCEQRKHLADIDRHHSVDLETIFKN